MKIKNIILFGFLLLVIVLVSVKSLSRGRFRSNTQKWTAATIDGSNRIADVNTLGGKILLVQLDGAEQAKDSAMYIPPAKILDKEYFKKLNSFDGNIVLISEDPALSARIWMILSQMGVKHLYILESSV